MTQDLNLHQELKCLRTHIVDFLTHQLKNDLITEKRASQIARSVLDNLTDNLTHDQIHGCLDKLKKDFPDELADIEATEAECETFVARTAVDKDILDQITEGNIDAALAKLDQYKLK